MEYGDNQKRMNRTPGMEKIWRMNKRWEDERIW